MAINDADRDAYEVHLDAPELGVRQRVGTLYRHKTLTHLPASFAYDASWLDSGQAFMLDPRLELWSGEQHPANRAPAFGVFLDSAPDRWGRVLMERREAAMAFRQQRKMRSLQEIDFLLGVHDLTRMGALRFRSVGGGPYLDNHDHAAPPVTSLKELAYISQRIEEPGVEKLPEYEQWLAMLIAPGTSLGGARPKANFTDNDGRIWLAKFPAREDRYDVGAWEFLVHNLARLAQIWIPDSRLEQLTEKHSTFCAARFDRMEGGRKMFASAMTLLERQDGEEGASYLDMAEFISDHGAQNYINGDLEQLFRRVVFNVLVGNRDDHLRNHGFIRYATGWRLAPAYDMNPNPAKAEHALALDEATVIPSIDVVMDTADFYRLDVPSAKRIVDEVRAVLRNWRDDAERLGLSRMEVMRMESVFAI